MGTRGHEFIFHTYGFVRNEAADNILLLSYLNIPNYGAEDNAWNSVAENATLML